MAVEIAKSRLDAGFSHWNGQRDPGRGAAGAMPELFFFAPFGRS